ncbi:MAG: hypothetical protein V1799_04410 [bacterium]
MPLVEHYSLTIWRQEEQRFRELEAAVRFPDARLNEVDLVDLSNPSEFDKIPESGGCYWLWTNEPVLHRLHKNPLPERFDNGEVIYNGIAKDNVRLRIKHHLMGEADAGWSGISIDIYPGKSRSHKKKACSTRGKVPYLDIDPLPPIRSKELLVELNLSDQEKNFINSSGQAIFYFRNGIDIREQKHRTNSFRAYYIITQPETLYLDFIEKKWRKQYGLPKLCSYTSGR